MTNDQIKSFLTRKSEILIDIIKAGNVVKTHINEMDKHQSTCDHLLESGLSANFIEHQWECLICGRRVDFDKINKPS